MLQCLIGILVAVMGVIGNILQQRAITALSDLKLGKLRLNCNFLSEVARFRNCFGGEMRHGLLEITNFPKGSVTSAMKVERMGMPKREIEQCLWWTLQLLA